MQNKNVQTPYRKLGYDNLERPNSCMKDNVKNQRSDQIGNLKNCKTKHKAKGNVYLNI